VTLSKLQADTSIFDLEDGENSCDEGENAGNDCTYVGPGETTTLRSVDDETNQHEDAGNEAYDNKSQNGGVLAD